MCYETGLQTLHRIEYSQFRQHILIFTSMACSALLVLHHTSFHKYIWTSKLKKLWLKNKYGKLNFILKIANFLWNWITVHVDIPMHSWTSIKVCNSSNAAKYRCSGTYVWLCYSQSKWIQRVQESSWRVLLLGTWGSSVNNTLISRLDIHFLFICLIEVEESHSQNNKKWQIWYPSYRAWVVFWLSEVDNLEKRVSVECVLQDVRRCWTWWQHPEPLDDQLGTHRCLWSHLLTAKVCLSISVCLDGFSVWSFSSLCVYDDESNSSWSVSNTSVWTDWTGWRWWIYSIIKVYPTEAILMCLSNVCDPTSMEAA